MESESNKPRVIVLGIDGLEYSLVTKWKLSNLQQKTFNKLDLSEYRVIVTPPIWGSMLTGKIDQEIMDFWVKQAQITGGGINTKQSWLAKIGDLLPPKLDLWIWDNICVPVVGDLFEKTANYVKEKNVPNVFKFFKKPWTNGVPGYGKVVSTAADRKIFQNAILGKDGVFKENMTKLYKKDKDDLILALKENNHDFIFWYTMILDKIGHVYFNKTLTLMKYYMEINELVGYVTDNFKNSKIFIISDHGMEKVKGGWGLHSNYGFFSSNNSDTIEKPYNLYDLLSKYRTT